MTLAKPSTPDLLPGVVYLTPCGRECRLAKEQPLIAKTGEAALVYDTPGGRPSRGSMADGFSLMPANWRVLRRLS